jgi:hypothetical protein
MAGRASPRVNDEVKNTAGFSQRLNALLAVVLAAVDRFNDRCVI